MDYSSRQSVKFVLFFCLTQGHYLERTGKESSFISGWKSPPILFLTENWACTCFSQLLLGVQEYVIKLDDFLLQVAVSGRGRGVHAGRLGGLADHCSSVNET